MLFSYDRVETSPKTIFPNYKIDIVTNISFDRVHKRDEARIDYRLVSKRQSIIFSP